MRTKTLLRSLIAILCFAVLLFGSTVFVAFPSEAKADTIEITQKSLIGTTNRVTLTENVTAEDEGIEGMDVGKSGLLIKSTRTGSNANGSGFKLAKQMRGKFSMEFRLLTDAGFEVEGNGWAKGGSNYDALDINPFADVKQLDITIEDATSGKSFVITIVSGTKYNRCTPMAAVKTGDMPEPKGIKYKDQWGDNVQATLNTLSYNYTTQLIGSSFMAQAESSLGFTATHNQYGVGGIPTKIEFDPYTGDVYGYGLAYVSSGVVVREKRVIINLANPDHVGEKNVIKEGDMNNYSVSVKFTTVIPNDYTVDLNSKSDGTGTVTNYPARTRYAKMLLYAINEQDLAGTKNTNGDYVISDTQGAIGFVDGGEIGAEIENTLSLKSYDYFEGISDYTEDVSWYMIDKYGNATQPQTITAADGYKITPDKIGTIYLTMPGALDSKGNRGETMNYAISIVSHIKPVIAASATMQKRNVFDISAIKNSTQSPLILGTDVCLANDDGRSYTVKTSVTTPTGKTHSDNVNALPYDVIGTYTAEYTVTDEFGNKVIFTRKFEVTDTEAPVIVLRDNNPAILLGDGYDLTPYQIIDNGDNTPSYTCEVYKDNQLVATLNGGMFTPDEVGEYKLVYSISDSYNNTASKEITLTVTKGAELTDDNSGDLTAYVVICVVASILVIGAGVALFLIANKKKGGQ